MIDFVGWSPDMSNELWSKDDVGDSPGEGLLFVIHRPMEMRDEERNLRMFHRSLVLIHNPQNFLPISDDSGSSVFSRGIDAFQRKVVADDVDWILVRWPSHWLAMVIEETIRCMNHSSTMLGEVKSRIVHRDKLHQAKSQSLRQTKRAFTEVLFENGVEQPWQRSQMEIGSGRRITEPNEKCVEIPIALSQATSAKSIGKMCEIMDGHLLGYQPAWRWRVMKTGRIFWLMWRTVGVSGDWGSIIDIDEWVRRRAEQLKLLFIRLERSMCTRPWLKKVNLERCRDFLLILSLASKNSLSIYSPWQSLVLLMMTPHGSLASFSWSIHGKVLRRRNDLHHWSTVRCVASPIVRSPNGDRFLLDQSDIHTPRDPIERSFFSHCMQPNLGANIRQIVETCSDILPESPKPSTVEISFQPRFVVISR